MSIMWQASGRSRLVIARALGQVFQNAIAAVWIRTGFRLAPSAGTYALDRVEDFDRAAARSVFV